MKLKSTMMSALAAAVLSAFAASASAQAGQGQEPVQSGASSGVSSSTGTTASGSAARSGGKMSGGSTGSSEVTVPMVVLVPPTPQEDAQLYNGCWVTLRDKEAMPGKGADLLTIVGAMNLPQLKTATGVDWSKKAGGLKVGPNATVTVFAAEQYQGQSAQLKGGQVVQDLNKQYGFVHSIDSMRVDCNA